MSHRIAATALLALASSALAAPPATAGIFGTKPIAISTGPNGEPANGPSGGATLSGDDRRTRLAAFHSDASNLVANDANRSSDVFLWQRPRGSNGLTLTGAGFRPLTRVSITDGGAQANGPSRNPALDGSLERAPRCVAFESEASNLAPGDSDTTADIFVRDLRAGRTYLVSRGFAAAATDPAIDGACRTVAFTSAGSVRLAPVRSGRIRSLGRGTNPDLSLDGSAVVWEKGSAVMIRRAGRMTRVAARGENPAVSDEESGIWGIAFDTSSRLSRRDRNRGVDAYTRIVRRRGKATRTDLISARRRGGSSLGGGAANGGITAFGANRGIITFSQRTRNGVTLYYRNNNSGNIDDLASSPERLDQVYTSARANFVAFTSTAGDFLRDGNGSVPDVFIKHLIDGRRI